jgi:hypothetical protein
MSYRPAGPRYRAPAVHLPAVLVGTVTVVTAYFLVVAIVLPGLADLIHALPEVVRYGFLLVVTSGTRVAGGWFAVRRLRRDRGLRHRGDGVGSALVTGIVAWLNVMALASVLGVAFGTDWMSWLLVVELLRWPAEAVLGGLMAFPGPPETQQHRVS